MEDATRTLTQERLKEVLDYDPETGEFTWKIRRAGTAQVGSVAGAISRRGYIEIGIDGIKHKAHRTAWLHMYGYLPENLIDHKNRIKDDNRIENLREAGFICNAQNRKIRSNNNSGVNWYNPTQKWQAQIQVNGKKKNLGYFDTLQEAAEARFKVEQEIPEYCTGSKSSAALFLEGQNKTERG